MREHELSTKEKKITKKWGESVERNPLGNADREPIARLSIHFKVTPLYEPPCSPHRISTNLGAATPRATLREATEDISYFDGYNFPLAQFVCASHQACEIVPQAAERDLTKLIGCDIEHFTTNPATWSPDSLIY